MHAKRISDGATIEYTPAVPLVAGQVFVLEKPHPVALVAEEDIPAGKPGALATEGVFEVAKDASAFTKDDWVYWNPTGDPVGGEKGSGAASLSDVGADGKAVVRLGRCEVSVKAEDPIVLVRLTETQKFILPDGPPAATRVAKPVVKPAVVKPVKK